MKTPLALRVRFVYEMCVVAKIAVCFVNACTQSRKLYALDLPRAIAFFA